MWHRLRRRSSAFRVFPHFSEFSPGGFRQPFFVRGLTIQFDHFRRFMAGGRHDLSLGRAGLRERDRRVLSEAVKAIAFAPGAVANDPELILKFVVVQRSAGFVG